MYYKADKTKIEKITQKLIKARTMEAVVDDILSSIN